MKKKSVLICLTVACICLAACGKKDTGNTQTTETTEAATVTTPETETAEAGTEEASTEEESSVQLDNGESAQYQVNIDMKDASQDITNKDGAVMVKVTESFPEVTIDGSAAAADNINDYYATEKKNFEALIEETKGSAEEDYDQRSAEEQKNWNGYEMSTQYSVARADDQCISIVNDGFDYTGGAHPNSYRSAATFDTASGERLSFEDIFTDVDKAKEFITDYLLTEMKDEKYKGQFFEDYEKDVPSILDDNTWYLSKDGFMVICNEYNVSPHSSGIMEFTIPYADFPLLSDSYKPVVK
ncbi:MAG: DUF3298 and DUF4163 domain-containing protein [Lachnospiraceae bacterium]|nr:DUF3298 and DUF4163 domain-containing protein [Lachnospiraceae bacterium]